MREFECPKCGARRESDTATSAYCTVCCVWMTTRAREEACTTCERVHRTSSDEALCRTQVSVMRIVYNERVAPEFSTRWCLTWIAEPTPGVH